MEISEADQSMLILILGNIPTFNDFIPHFILVLLKNICLIHAERLEDFGFSSTIVL